MKKQIITLPCIAAVAIATYVGKKTFESHANETSSLLMQNIEALTQEENIKAGALITCSGEASYSYAEIRSGYFKRYRHDESATEMKDGEIIYYDEEIDVNYEICVAKGSGNVVGNNVQHGLSQGSSRRVICTGDCNGNYMELFADILRNARN